MRRTAHTDGLPLLGLVHRSPARARLRPRIEAGVQRIIRLAPVLGRCNPDAVATVEEVMRLLIGSPPPRGGLRAGVPLRGAA